MIESPEYTTPTIETVKINSFTMPIKTNSSYGNWVVYADASFNKGGKTWEYPNKGYYFFTKKRAMEFITDSINQ